MAESAIKADIFPSVKVKKKVAAITPKPRTALLQEGENNVALSSKITACESSSKGLNSKVASARTFDDISNDVTDKAQLVHTQLHDPPMQISCAAGASKVGERENLSLDMSSKFPFENETLMDHDSVVILASKSSEVVDFNSKPRTALFKGREDDEPIAPEDIQTVQSGIMLNMVTGDSLELSDLKFGAVHFDAKYSKNMDKFTTVGLSSKICFRGALLFGKEEKRQGKEICLFRNYARGDKRQPNRNASTLFGN
jgi:hypothetical protein